MADPARPSRVVLGDCVLDRDARQLTRAGQPVRLSPKAYALLDVLLDAAPRALSKSQLMERLWPSTFVVEANLSNLVSDLRAGLADDPARSRCVRTINGFGYALEQAAPPARGTRYLLFVDRTPFELGPGEHLLGRHEASVVPLCATSVSRRHARLSLDGQRAVLSDLGSRNGTWVCGVRTERPVVLRSGDEIRLGPFRLSLNAWPMAGTTQDNEVAAPVAWRPSFDQELAAASA